MLVFGRSSSVRNPDSALSVSAGLAAVVPPCCIAAKAQRSRNLHRRPPPFEVLQRIEVRGKFTFVCVPDPSICLRPVCVAPRYARGILRSVCVRSALHRDALTGFFDLSASGLRCTAIRSRDSSIRLRPVCVAPRCAHGILRSVCVPSALHRDALTGFFDLSASRLRCNAMRSRDRQSVELYSFCSRPSILAAGFAACSTAEEYREHAYAEAHCRHAAVQSSLVMQGGSVRTGRPEPPAEGRARRTGSRSLSGEE
jgi:hypothetical protein